jgi:hypothetical protein
MAGSERWIGKMDREDGSDRWTGKMDRTDGPGRWIGQMDREDGSERWTGKWREDGPGNGGKMDREMLSYRREGTCTHSLFTHFLVVIQKSYL